MEQGTSSVGQYYETKMVLVTSLAISFLAFDRLATGYLGPFLVRDLGLSNTELGALYSVQAVAVALAGFGMGWVSDKTGKRVGLLAPLLLLAALCATGSLLVQGFAVLLMLRLASGLALGGVSPIAQSIVTVQSAPSRVGRNIGIQTLLMFLVSQMAGPILIPRIAERWGWQAGYAASALPFILLAVAGLFLLRETIAPTQQRLAVPVPVGRLDPAARRTVWLCTGISACFMIWLVVHSTFLSVFLVQNSGLTPTEAGNIFGTLGLAGAIGGLLIPLISDRFGRRRVLVCGLILSMLVPASVILLAEHLWPLHIGLFLGWMAVGVLPVYAVLVPGSAVPPGRMAATIAIIVGAGELVGGVIGPVIAGYLADTVSLMAPFVFALILVGVGLALAMLLPAPPRSGNA